MSDDGSRATIHEGSGRRRGFTSEYTVSRGDQAGTAHVDMPDTLEGPQFVGHSNNKLYNFDNPSYEAFPPEEEGQGVLFHRTRPTIAGWYGTGNSMLNGEALAGAIHQSIKHTGMFPKPDTTLSKDSGAVVANTVGDPSVKDDATFLDDRDGTKYGADIAEMNASYARRTLGRNKIADTYRGYGALRDTTDEERTEARGALRELPKYKAIYKAMAAGQQWDPNTISAFRNRNAKLEQPKPERVKVDPNQLELDLS